MASPDTPHALRDEAELLRPDTDPTVFAKLKKVFDLFSRILTDPDLASSHKDFSTSLDAAERACDAEDSDGMESALTRIYCHLHARDAAYSPGELAELRRYGGYWCYAGGLSPLFMAEPYITPETVSADFGAGNGLQGLVLQALFPHRKTVQIELGAQMVERGRLLQRAAGIEDARIEWVHGNILDADPGAFDFIYLYRPVRPDGEGRDFYRTLARRMEAVEKTLTVFSVADCLRDSMGNNFRVVHDDGHLVCFRNV